ncbi:MAG: ComF family protein [Chthoniobacterales bacterium]
MLGVLMANALEDERLRGVSFTAVVPVPLYFLREREREFNQASLLAYEVAKKLNLPVEACLKRVKPTSMQARANRQARIKNLQGAFAIKKGYRCSGNYLLIDDVFTTGSTADECSKVLLKSGARGIWVLAAARS